MTRVFSLVRILPLLWTSRDVPEPQSVNVDPAGADTVCVPAAMPPVAILAVPIMTIVCFANDVIPVRGSIDVDVLFDVNTSVHVDILVDILIDANVSVRVSGFADVSFLVDWFSES